MGVFLSAAIVCGLITFGFSLAWMLLQWLLNNGVIILSKRDKSIAITSQGKDGQQEIRFEIHKQNKVGKKIYLVAGDGELIKATGEGNALAVFPTVKEAKTCCESFTAAGDGEYKVFPGMLYMDGKEVEENGTID